MGARPLQAEPAKTALHEWALDALADVKAKLREMRQAAKRLNYVVLVVEEKMGLEDFRKAAGYGQSELARKLGMSQPSVAQFERGSRGGRKLSTLRTYAEAAGHEIVVIARRKGDPDDVGFELDV